MGISYEGRLLALGTNIGLRWKGITVTNALAYNAAETITALKSLEASDAN
jgi:hypothetical protein